MWKKCDWYGATNSARWAHIRAVRWSTTFAEAVAYYPADTSESFRLETVFGQFAGVLTRKTAPLACFSIDRRCLYALWEALEKSDVVQSICFSCAFSYPYVSVSVGRALLVRKRLLDLVTPCVDFRSKGCCKSSASPRSLRNSVAEYGMVQRPICTF